MNFRTYKDLADCINKNIGKIPKDIDLVVGIPRSGTMVANMIALYLNLPFMDLNSFIGRGEIKTGSTRKCISWIKSVDDAKHVLVVDDSISSGKAIREAKHKIAESCLPCKATYLAIYALGISCKMADIYFEICEQPRMFEWNYMHHWALEFSCMDIDGVICDNPLFWQNDDGRRYQDFVANAVPRFVPTQKVGYLVSCRLEKYRADTEKWLQLFGVKYDHLILPNNISAKERMYDFNHAAYKAQIYQESKCIMFFESDYDQALEICRLSGKPVFCVDKREMITGDNVLEKIVNRNREWRVTFKRVVKKILKKINYVE